MYELAHILCPRCRAFLQWQGRTEHSATPE